jgi:hypothetical protein
MTTDAVGLVGIQAFHLLGPGVNTFIIEISDGFMTEKFPGGWIFLGMTLLIAAYTFLYGPMRQFLNIIMAVTTRNITVNRLREHLRWYMVRPEDAFLRDASHAGILVTHETGFVILEGSLADR